jgi:hypothetical protein
MEQIETLATEQRKRVSALERDSVEGERSTGPVQGGLFFDLFRSVFCSYPFVLLVCFISVPLIFLVVGGFVRWFR